jgi:carbon monoxide dehydrogenase subunit G
MKWVLRIAGGFAALLVIGAAVLLALGHRVDAGRVHVSTEINASAQQLWPWLNDQDKLKQWITWLVEIRPAEVRQDRSRTGVGTKQVWVMRDENNRGQLMEMEGTFTEYQPPLRESVRISSAGTFDGQQTYIVENLGAGRARLNIDGTYRYAQWFAALMEPLITPAAEKKLRQDVARLKALVEKEKNGTASSAF